MTLAGHARQVVIADRRSRVIVVDANSASPQLPGVTYYGVEATHAHMCKFASASAPGFRALSTDIRQWALDAPSLVAVRWEVEGLERAARMRHEMRERMSPFVSSAPWASSRPEWGPCADARREKMSPLPDAYTVATRREGQVPSLAATSPSQPLAPPPSPPMAHAVPRALLAAAAGQDGLVLLDGMGRGLEPVYRMRS